MRFLVFTLYAPMGAFGEIAVGERRMSWTRPGRSAILGLIAAALGIERVDEDAHQRLESGLYCAVRTDAPGQPLIDHHTAQTPKARKGHRFTTRRAELESDDLNTVLSVREWRSDSCFTAVLWRRPGSTVDFEAIVGALRSPRFVLYVGRKSAPLGLPLNPEIIEADTFMGALDARQPNDEEQRVVQRTRTIGATQRAVAFDDDAPGAPAEARVERRRDAIASRARWQFADRLERVTVAETDEL